MDFTQFWWSILCFFHLCQNPGDLQAEYSVPFSFYCLEQEERITKSEVGSPGDLISHFVSFGASYLSFSASLFSQLLGHRNGQHWVICRDVSEFRDCHIE